MTGTPPVDQNQPLKTVGRIRGKEAQLILVPSVPSFEGVRKARGSMMGARGVCVSRHAQGRVGVHSRHATTSLAALPLLPSALTSFPDEKINPAARQPASSHAPGDLRSSWDKTQPPCAHGPIAPTAWTDNPGGSCGPRRPVRPLSLGRGRPSGKGVRAA